MAHDIPLKRADVLPLGVERSTYQTWKISPGGHHRDSEALERANHRAAVARLNRTDADDWTILRFRHWAVGWIEEILVRPDTEAERIGRGLVAELASYPVLDELLLAEEEHEDEGAEPEADETLSADGDDD